MLRLRAWLVVSSSNLWTGPERDGVGNFPPSLPFDPPDSIALWANGDGGRTLVVGGCDHGGVRARNSLLG